MNIEKTCADAIAVVERYLAGDMYRCQRITEFNEAQGAVVKAWASVTEGHRSKSYKLCRTAWNACLAAKNDKRIIAKTYVAEFRGSV